jgi:CubicO group peptidase (beta-lactamase class C family)
MPAALTLAVVLAAGASILYCALSADLSAPRCSQMYTAPRYAAIAQRASRLAREIKTGLDAPTLSIAVARHGRLLWSQSFGLADVKRRTPACRTTLINVGSVAKVFTGAAIGQLWQEGKIGLDVPIQRYVPSFPRKRWPITPRELALHLSGIRHYEGDEFASTRHYPSLRAGLSIFEDDPLLFRPGTQFHYSSYGYNLLGVAIEGVSHEDYLRYMAQHVFGPRHMSHTVPDRGPKTPGRATFYQEIAAGVVRPAPHTDVSYKWPSGGYLSTPDDLVRFGSSLMRPGFLDSRTVRLLFTPGRTRSGKATGYSFGWEIGRDPSGHVGYRALGSALGAIGMLALLPHSGLAIAITANVNVAPGVEAGPTPNPLQIAQLFSASSGRSRDPTGRRTAKENHIGESWPPVRSSQGKPLMIRVGGCASRCCTG